MSVISTLPRFDLAKPLIGGHGYPAIYGSQQNIFQSFLLPDAERTKEKEAA